MDVVQAIAGDARAQLWRMARSAHEALGPNDDVMTMQEASLRIFCHDALFPHHDRDVRTFAAFSLDLLRKVELRIWLVGPWGKLRELIFHGPSEQGTKRTRRTYAGRASCT